MENSQSLFEMLGDVLVETGENFGEYDPPQTLSVIRKIQVPLSWEEIGRVAKEGRLDSILKSGDFIPMTLKNGEEIGLDVGQDETGKFFFVFHNLMHDLRPMNRTDTTRGKWRDSEMRSTANSTIFSMLPDDLASVIVPTKIVQIEDEERIETEDKLFCLSATQVFGREEGWSDYEPEDTQIDLFRDPRNRCKVCDQYDYCYYWWLRSSDDPAYFRYVCSNGSRSYYYADISHGVALGFCLEP